MSKDTVLAVALPEEYLEFDELRSKIRIEWAAETITYDIYHDRPVHDVREIMARVKDFLQARGYFS